MKKAISKIFSAFKRAKGDIENRATVEGGAKVFIAFGVQYDCPDLS